MFFCTIYRDSIGLWRFILAQLYIYKFIWWQYTFSELFDRTVCTVGRNKVAIYYEDISWTFGDLDNYSNKVANMLLKYGYKKGDVIALFMESCPAYIGIWVGAAKIGVAVSFINTNLRKYSLCHSINSVKSRGIVVGLKLKAAFQNICKDINFSFENVWIFCENEIRMTADLLTVDQNFCNLDKELFLMSCAAPPLPRIKNNREHLIYIFTSGTTGLPKAAIISKLRFVVMTTFIHFMCKIKCSDVIYDALPLYHSSGGIIGVGQMLLFGSTIVIRSKFSVSQFWTDCIRYECTVAQYIGEICRYLLVQSPRDTDQKHQVRVFFGNGIRRQIWYEFKQRFKISQITEFYGATESISNLINFDNTPGAVGFLSRTLPFIYPVYLIKINVETQEPIRNGQTGLCQLCSPNEPGELIGKISSSNPIRMYDGYLNKENSQKKLLHNVIDSGDSWFASGDLLYYDELGYLYFLDRMGDTFRWRGENVSTSEVENVLDSAIEQQMNGTVYGVKLEGIEGRAGMAAIEVGQTSLDSDAEAGLVQKLEHIFKEQLPSYAQPLFLRFCPQLEMTSTYKFCKNELVKMGFDPNVPNNRVYFMDPQSKTYKLLDQTIYNQIISGMIRY